MFITNETVSRRTANGKPTAQRYKELHPLKNSPIETRTSIKKDKVSQSVTIKINLIEDRKEKMQYIIYSKLNPSINES
jgi:hypothetical protein